MKKLVIAFFVVTSIFLLVWFTPTKSTIYWLFIKDLPVETSTIPIKNKEIINFVELRGKTLAPSYNDVVCTEYVINVLGNFTALSKSDKTKIRIITNEDLSKLISSDADIIKGVYFQLTSSGNGIPINSLEEAKAGDFIQFWNSFLGVSSGHCGIIRAIDIDKGLISIYSSSPRTDGFGKQIYLIPQKYYIARLK